MPSYTSNFVFKNVALMPNWVAASTGMTWAGDLNQDGKDDLIVLGMTFPPGPTAPQQGAVFFGDGKGNFTPISNATFPIDALKTVHPRQILASDFNGDGRLDVLVVGHGYDTNPFPGEQNHLFFSQLNGTWIDATSSLPQLLDFSHSAAIGDINGDGTKDIFVGNINGEQRIAPYVLLNDGLGHFTRTTAPLPPQLMSMFPFFYTSSLLVDLNNDGRRDLVAGLAGTGVSGGTSMVFWNTGSSFDSTHVTPIPTGQIADDNRIVLSIASIDINRDGLPDLITLSTLHSPFYVGEFVDVYLNTGANGFRLANSEVLRGTTSIGSGGWSTFLRVVDANGDGQLDVTLSEYSGALASAQSPFLLLNDGMGHLSAVAVQDIATNIQPFRFNALPIHTDQGLSFVTVYAQNGVLFANELIATSPLPALATNTLGGSGDDRLSGTSANEAFDGGAGLDLALMRGQAIEYRLGVSNGVVTLTDTVSGRDGQDTFVQVERIQFQDKVIAFDLAGDAGQAYRMYQAAFARTPDKDGVSFWVSQVDRGMSLHDMATAFIGSNEFKGIYGANPSVQTLVSGFYTNVLGRAPDASGLSFWVGQVQSGLSTADMLVSFSESGENKAHVASAIQNGIELSLSFFA